MGKSQHGADGTKKTDGWSDDRRGEVAEMNESYFSEGNMNTRFFVYYGNTNDLFVDGTLYPLTIRQALHRELVQNGYRRIIFYGYTEGAFFLDEESKRLWHGENKEEVVRESLFPNKMLKGRIIRREETKNQPEREALQFSVSPAEMLRYTEHFLNDNDILTAIIFPDGAEAIKEFSKLDQGKMLDNFFAQTTRASLSRISNRNVVLFLFNRTRGQAEENILSGIERESVRRYLSDTAVTTTHIIPCPTKREVRNMLNYLRIYGIEDCKLMIEISELDQTSDMIARRLVYNASRKERDLSSETLQACDMHGTIQYLKKNYIEKRKEFRLDVCRRICQKENGSTARARLDGLVGLQALKDAADRLKELCNRSKKNREERTLELRLSCPHNAEEKDLNLHIVLTGGPGTGKSTAAMLLGEIFCDYGLLPSGHTVITSPGRLKGNVIGASEQNVREAVQQAMGGVLFIDEAYGLADDDPFSRAMVTELVAEMEQYRGKFSLILAGYPDDIERLWETNRGFRDRFADNSRINIEDYTPDELTQIFISMAKKRSLTVSEELTAILPGLFENWYYAESRQIWSNAREVRNLLDAMEKEHTDGYLTVEQIPENFRKYWDGSVQDDAMAQLDSLIGLHNVKNELHRIIRTIRYEEKARPRNYIFAGNPGTGKTTVAGILGKILKTLKVIKSSRLVTASPDDLIAEYVGQTTPKARRVFDSAMDGTLFIDEAYRLIHDSAGNSFGAEVMNLLLDYTDPGKNLPICFICAGYEKEMEEFLGFNSGLWRRFTVIHFDDYSPEDLLEILKQTLFKEGYTGEEDYFAAALDNFRFHSEVIAEKYNGGYISFYFSESKDRLFKRLDEQYGSPEQTPQNERRLLKRMDAPKTSWCPLGAYSDLS